MMNAVWSPRNASLFTTIPATARTARLSATSPNEMRVAPVTKKAGIRNAITASRAVHGTSGASRIVSQRARRSSMMREPRTAGTLQPKPRKSGMNDLPCSPIRCMKRSMTYAPRAR